MDGSCAHCRRVHSFNCRLSAAFHKYGEAPRAARRPSRKARGGRIPGVFDRRATQRDGMHRRPNATVFMKRATNVAGRRLVRVGLILPDDRIKLWHSRAIAAIHHQVSSIEVVTVGHDSDPNPLDVVIDFGAAAWCDAWVPSYEFRLNPAFGVWRYGF